MYDAVIISDLHLGSKVCQSKLLLKFLSNFEDHDFSKKLILNGDVFDSWDFRRLCKKHWKILSLFRKISKHTNIIWINGNHDGPSEVVSHLLGIEVVEEYVFESGSKNIMILHGHMFDNFIADHPVFTWIADRFYCFLQKLHLQGARYLKQRSKTFLRCSEQIEQKARAYAASKDCSVVCCGHTHYALATEIDSIEYYNSGCWTEVPCSFIGIKNGMLGVNYFRE